MKVWQDVAVALIVMLGGGLCPAVHAQNVVNAVQDEPGDPDTTSPRRLQPEPTIGIDQLNIDIMAAGAQDFRRTTQLNEACGGDRWNGLYLLSGAGVVLDNSLVPGYCTDPTQGAGTEQATSEMFGLSTNTDPVLVFDRFHNFYYSHIAFNNDPKRTTPPSASGVLYVSFYRDEGGGAFAHAKTVKVPSGSGLRKAPQEVGPGNSNFDDKQWMAVDNSPFSDFFGRVYVTWTKFAAQGGQSAIWISHCGGDGPDQQVCEEFSDGKVVNKPLAGGLVQESFPAVGPDGELYIAFLQFQGGFGSTRPHSGIWIIKSTDGGETFTAQKQVAPIAQIPSPIPPAGSAANDGFNSFRTGTAPGVAVTADGTVHLVWGEWVNGTNAEVRYARSLDGGATWSTPIGMNDDPTGHQFFPSIVADGNDVHVAWFDGRLNPAGATITDLQVFYNRSTDSGASFEPDIAASEQPFDPNQVSRFPVFCAAFIGDYIDIDAVDGRVSIIWSDNSNVVNPLTPAECQDFRTRPADPTIQNRLNSGALDQDAFVAIDPSGPGT
jgi:hypothetical protein